MKTIYLISCVKTKSKDKAPARELYSGGWFKKALAYAERQTHDKIYLLSTEYHLLPLDIVVKRVDKPMKTMSAAENREWAKEVLSELEKVSSLENDKFVILAGKKYWKNLIKGDKCLKNYEIPMEGLGLLKQKHWLKEKLNQE